MLPKAFISLARWTIDTYRLVNTFLVLYCCNAAGHNGYHESRHVALSKKVNMFFHLQLWVINLVCLEPRLFCLTAHCYEVHRNSQSLSGLQNGRVSGWAGWRAGVRAGVS